MKVKIKKLRSEAKLPTRATSGSAGYDLYSPVALTPAYAEYSPPPVLELGIAIEIPQGYVGLIAPRSGNSIELKNTIGLIDSDYRGEIKLKLKSYPSIEAQERIAQLVISPVLNFEWEEVDELSETSRGIGGFGSTGKN